MLATPTNRTEPEADPFVLYAQSLHDYTLQLWIESRRIAEEKAHTKAAAAAAARKQEEQQKHREAGSS
ncbi:hypothetical protein CERSUDRAFT_79483 [Gelatoporia subvermispora B]|uniref:Uncharacterized protein n=1 Tax=Ceriporiopsis subvermispora (strain B) TaxID=914234 RepID=M2RTT4_CERS8|nr:hypothetical protein CERSUDRAFT_79483 [Gelatoporia subvermispora B]